MFRRSCHVLAKLCALAGLCCFSLPAAAQCPPKTTVSDTLYNADGSTASGRVVVTWPTYQIGSCQVIAGQTTVTVTAGAFSVQLYPNDVSLPAGTSYRVTYYLKTGKVTTEYWVIPTSATPVAIAAVRSPSVPVPTVMFSQAQVTNLVPDLAKKVELPSPCPTGKFLQSNGSTSPPQVACVDVTGGSGSQHQVNGGNLAANNPVNFQDTATISFTNPSVGNVQAAVKDSSIGAVKLSVSSPTAAQLSGIADANIAAGALSANRVAGTAEVQTNKAAAGGYASLNSSTKVVQDPASAQTTPAASKMPLADGVGKIADGWLSANVSLLGPLIDLGSEVTGTLGETRGGTNQTSYILGDILYASAANTLSKLPGNTSTTRQFLRQTGNGSSSAAPAWDTIQSADVPFQTVPFVAMTASTEVPNERVLTPGDSLKLTDSGAGGNVTLKTQIWLVIPLVGRFFTWADQPAAVTEFPEAPRIKVDLTDASQIAFGASVSTAGAAGAVLFLQYSTDESTWNALTINQIAINTTGTKRTAFESIPAAAKADVFIRLVGQNGNATVDPAFRAGTVVWIK